MVDNQHQKIKGYRDLSFDEIGLINRIKGEAAEIEALIDQLVGGPNAGGLDQRWVHIGKTHLQQGFMALVRAVAQPESF